jgi:hypothetical protein
VHDNYNSDIIWLEYLAFLVRALLSNFVCREMLLTLDIYYQRKHARKSTEGGDEEDESEEREDVLSQITVAERATRNLPWSGELWASYMALTVCLDCLSFHRARNLRDS